MAACQCPRCNASHFMRPKEAHEWLIKNAPHRRPDGIYAILCFKCWKELAESKAETPSKDPK